MCSPFALSRVESNEVIRQLHGTFELRQHARLDGIAKGILNVLLGRFERWLAAVATLSLHIV